MAFGALYRGDKWKTGPLCALWMPIMYYGHLWKWAMRYMVTDMPL
jgi:hypothetical protein